MRPETKYARSGDVNIAYQVLGADGHRLVDRVEIWKVAVDDFLHPTFIGGLSWR